MVDNVYNLIVSHSVFLPFMVGEKVEPPTKFSKREGGLAWQDLYFYSGIAWKRGVTSIRGGGCTFCIKNKLNSEIFNDKKVYKQKCVAVITKNSNWENKNLVTLKEIRRGDG